MSSLEIDWVAQFTQAQPYLQGRGGVVCIHGTPSSACNSFLKQIRGRLRQGDCHTLQLNPEDPTTRTPDDILVKIADRIGLSSSPQAPPLVTVASDIEAGGNVNVHDVVVNVGGPARSAAQVREITGQMRAVLANRRIVLILDNWQRGAPGIPPEYEMPISTVRWFWQTLWPDGLEPLADSGLLVLCVYETTDRFPHPSFAHSPDCRIQLPAKYEGEARQVAIRDIAELLKDPSETLDVTQIRAETFLRAWDDEPAQVHGRLPGIIDLGFSAT